MRLFDDGRPLRFGLIVERLNDIGVRLSRDHGTVIGPGGVSDTFIFERRDHPDGLILVAWHPMDPEEMVPVGQQCLLARRLGLSPEQTQSVFGWMRI